VNKRFMKTPLRSRMCCQVVIYVGVARIKLRWNKLRCCLRAACGISQRLLMCGNLVPGGKNL
jgi:hypothetical protein